MLLSTRRICCTEGRRNAVALSHVDGRHPVFEPPQPRDQENGAFSPMSFRARSKDMDYGEGEHWVCLLAGARVPPRSVGYPQTIGSLSRPYSLDFQALVFFSSPREIELAQVTLPPLVFVLSSS